MRSTVGWWYRIANPGEEDKWVQWCFALQLLGRVRASGNLRTSERLAHEASEGEERPFSSP